MHSSPQPPSNLFGIVFLQAVRRNLPLLLLATIIAGLATYFAQSWITPRYVAEARLALAEPVSREAAEAHIRGLKDPIGLFSAASELGLRNWPEFNEGEGSGLLTQLSLSNQPSLAGLNEADERMLAAVYEKFAAVRADGNGGIAVSLVASDPDLAASFVNWVVEHYISRLASNATVDGVAAGSSVQVAAWAEPPQRPAFPRRGPIAMLGMAITLLLGLGAIAVREGFRSAALHRQEQPVHRFELAKFDRVSSPTAAADQLLSLPASDRGCRIMVAGEAPDIDATAEAIGLAERLSQAGRRVLIVRWSLAGGSVAGGRPRPGLVGLNDLIEGRSTFEEIITRLPGSRAHAIAAGSMALARETVLDPDRLGLVLDTLDEVYEFIVLVAEHEEARTLFAAIEGRFDTCLSVGMTGRAVGALAAEMDRFLGFEVTDIQVLRLVRRRQAKPRNESVGAPLVARLA